MLVRRTHFSAPIRFTFPLILLCLYVHVQQRGMKLPFSFFACRVFEGVKNTRNGGFELGFQKLNRFPPFYFKKNFFEIYSFEIKDNARSRIDKLFYPGSLTTASYVQSTRYDDLALISR